jgi:phosphomannomutase
MYCYQQKTKAKFTKEDDELIIKYVETKRAENEDINWMKVKDYFLWRTNKQIRERYLNFLSSSINRNPLSASEFKCLIETIQGYLYFPCIPWKKISTPFPGRSDIFLKIDMIMQEEE